MSISEKSFNLLGDIKAAMQAQPGYVMLTEKQAAELQAAGLIEGNTTITEGSGAVKKFAYRATQEGLNYTMTDTNNQTAANSPATAAPAASAFEIDSDVPMPTGSRGGRTSNKYPFDSLEVGQSFHVPVSEAMPKPSKTLASTVSTATARFAKKLTNPDGSPLIETVTVKGKTLTRQKTEPTRIFTVVAVGAEDKRGPGARVFRKQ